MKHHILTAGAIRLGKFAGSDRSRKPWRMRNRDADDTQHVAEILQLVLCSRMRDRTIVDIVPELARSVEANLEIRIREMRDHSIDSRPWPIVQEQVEVARAHDSPRRHHMLDRKRYDFVRPIQQSRHPDIRG